MQLRLLSSLIVAALPALAAPTRAAPPSQLTFEGGLVRPLALSPDGSHLFAVNAPDGRLAIFAVDDPA